MSQNYRSDIVNSVGFGNEERYERVVTLKEQHFGAIGRVICGYSAENLITISWLHKHFNIAASEWLVARVEPAHVYIAPYPINEACCKPYSWKWSDQEGAWFPLTFLYLDAPSTDLLVARIQSLQRQTACLAELARYFQAHLLSDLFGVTTLFDDQLPVEPHQLLLETTDVAARRSTIVPSTNKNAYYETLWRFNQDGNYQTVLNCC